MSSCAQGLHLLIKMPWIDGRLPHLIVVIQIRYVLSQPYWVALYYFSRQHKPVHDKRIRWNLQEYRKVE